MVQYLKPKAIPAKSALPREPVSAVVTGVIETIRSEGDAAVRRYSQKFDKWSPTSFKLSKADIENSISAVPEQTLKDIKEVRKSNSHTGKMYFLYELRSWELFKELKKVFYIMWGPGP